jgi:hypothetical protein
MHRVPLLFECQSVSDKQVIPGQEPDLRSPCSLQTSDLPNSVVLLNDGLQSNDQGASASNVLGTRRSKGVVGGSQGLVGASGFPADVVVEVVVKRTNDRSAPLSMPQ